MVRRALAKFSVDTGQDSYLSNNVLHLMVTEAEFFAYAFVAIGDSRMFSQKLQNAFGVFC
jgi:hypothetical protein